MRNLLVIVLVLAATGIRAQSVSAKSNELIVDFSDPRSDHSVSMSTITWVTPVDTITHLSQELVTIAADVKSKYGALTARLRVKDLKADKILNDFKIPIDDSNKNDLHIEQNLTLSKGEYEIEILAENLEGFFVRATRIVIVDVESSSKK